MSENTNSRLTLQENLRKFQNSAGIIQKYKDDDALAFEGFVALTHIFETTEFDKEKYNVDFIF